MVEEKQLYFWTINIPAIAPMASLCIKFGKTFCVHMVKMFIHSQNYSHENNELMFMFNISQIVNELTRYIPCCRD